MRLQTTWDRSVSWVRSWGEGGPEETYEENVVTPANVGDGNGSDLADEGVEGEAEFLVVRHLMECQA